MTDDFALLLCDPSPRAQRAVEKVRRQIAKLLRRKSLGKIPLKLRNHGESSGLEYPWLSGRDPRGGEMWLVWHRHRGTISFVASDQNPTLWQYSARRVADRLNGVPPMSAAMAAELDAVP